MTLQEERLAMAADAVAEKTSPRVVVVVGSDHHPFDRLVGWVACWLEEHPEQRGSFFVQAGTSSTVPPCQAAPLLRHDALKDLLQQADVVISHGGPGSALDCWNRGILPIVVPRLRRYGEHVDDHQLDFCRAQNDAGRVLLVESYDQLKHHLERATVDPTSFRCEIPGGNVSATVAKFAELVEELVDQPRPSFLRHAGAGRRSRRARTSTRRIHIPFITVNGTMAHADRMAVGRKEQQ